MLQGTHLASFAPAAADNIVSFLIFSHFETSAQDVLSLYHRITGEELDMTVPADLDDEDC